MATKKRKYTNWSAVEPLYRQANLSNYEICQQYELDHINSQTWKRTVTEAAIRKRAKDKGWRRDLASKVQKQIKEKLVRNLVRNAYQNEPDQTDREIVEKAAELASCVVIRHQKEINALLKHEDILLDQLLNNPTRTHVAMYKGELLSKEVDLTIKEKSSTLKDLATVRAQRIALERQAYSLDADPRQDQDMEQLTEKQLDKRLSALIGEAKL